MLLSAVQGSAKLKRRLLRAKRHNVVEGIKWRASASKQDAGSLFSQPSEARRRDRLQARRFARVVRAHEDADRRQALDEPLAHAPKRFDLQG